MNNNENLLKKAQHNLEVTKKQYLDVRKRTVDFESSTDPLVKAIKGNYINAKRNLKLISKMYLKKNEEGNTELENVVEESRENLDSNVDGHIVNGTQRKQFEDDKQVVLSNQPAGEKITIHFPDLEELRSAISYSNASRTKIQMPASDTKSAEPAAKSAEPVAKVPEAKPDKKAKKPVTKKMSTREAMREATRQAFIGSPKKAKKKKATTKVKKTTKKADSESKDNSTMTREQYRKLHNQKK